MAKLTKSLSFLALGCFLAVGYMYGDAKANGNGEVQTKSDGTKMFQDSDGTSVEIKPDGTKIIKKRDGTFIKVSPDGTKSIKNPDGSSIDIKPGQSS